MQKWFGKVSPNDATTSGISKAQGRVDEGQGPESQWETRTEQEIPKFSVPVKTLTHCSAWCSDLEEFKLCQTPQKMLLCIRKDLREVRCAGRFITEDPILINPHFTLTANCRHCDLPFPGSAVNQAFF